MKKIRNQVTKFRAAVAVKVLQAKYKLFENTGEGYVDTAVSYTHLEKLLRDFLKKESLEYEGERVLAPYLRNKLLERKVYSMTPAVEEWDGKLWGVLDVQAYGKLSEGELEGLKEEWEGQCSDGFGEGFAQQPLSLIHI